MRRMALALRRADCMRVTWIQRHLIAIALTAIMVAAVSAAFVILRPSAGQAIRVTTVHMQDERLVTVVDVEKAFAAHGVALSVKAQTGGRNAMTILSNSPGGKPTPFTVSVFGPRATVTFAPPVDSNSYDAQFANLQVHYGGFNKRFRSKVEAAADDLQS
jgi:hypothetical protein